MLRSVISGSSMHLCLFIITAVPLIRLSEGVCDPSAFAKWEWPARAAMQGVFAGSPKYALPRIGSGFNRTLNMEGFCNNILWKSNFFTCWKDVNADARVWFAKPKAEEAATILFDNSVCELTGVVISRTQPGSPFEAEMQFEFAKCGAPAPLNTRAAVVVGLQKALFRGVNLVPWMREVCEAKTTTPASSSVAVSSQTQILLVGKGTCKGKAVAKPNVLTKAACEAECTSGAQVAKLVGKKDEICYGYAFCDGKSCNNATAGVSQLCNLYLGANVVEIDKAGEDWECLHEAVVKQEYHKPTATPAPIDKLPELTQNLHFREVMAGPLATMTTAKLFQIQSDEKPTACFDPSWWFRIQDDTGNQASLPVLEAEWAELMTMLPPLLSKPKPVEGTVVLDRVMFKTCHSNQVGWGRTCETPTVVESTCDAPQLINAIITGIVVPVVGWLVVYGVFGRMPASCMVNSGSRSLDTDTHDEGNLPQCRLQGFIACCLVGITTCIMVAFMCAAAVSYAFGAEKCEHGTREMSVIGCAAGVPGSLAIVVGLLYVQLSGSKQKTSKAAEASASPSHGQKLMLVEVDEHGNRGRPLNPDIMQTGNSAMSSYSAQARPQDIQLHTADMPGALGSFQPGPHSPMNSTMGTMQGGSAMGSAMGSANGQPNPMGSAMGSHMQSGRGGE